MSARCTEADLDARQAEREQALQHAFDQLAADAELPLTVRAFAVATAVVALAAAASALWPLGVAL